MGIKIKGSAPYQRLNNEGQVEKHSPTKKQLLFRFFVVKPFKWVKSVFGFKDKPASEYLRMTGKILGQGGFGCIEKVETKGEVRAYKNTRPGINPVLAAEQEKDLAKEASILQKLRHPHIVKSLGNPETKEVIAIRTHDLSDPEINEPSDEDWVVVDSVTQQKAGLQLELAETDLRKKIHTLDKKERFRQALNLLSAVSYMHQQGICYLDIKPDNILWVDGKAVCADFGGGLESGNSVSAQITSQMLDKIAFTADYAAPELLALMRNKRAEPVEGFLCDSWALACTLIELITGETLVDYGNHMVNNEAMHYIIDLPPGERIVEYYRVRLAECFKQHEKTLGKEATKIFKAMLSIDPDKRMTVHEALEKFPVIQ